MNRKISAIDRTNRRFCLWLIIFIFLLFSGFNLYAQEPRAGGRDSNHPHDDFEVAAQYVRWIQRALDEKRWDDAAAALNRTEEFAGVSSDISYLHVYIYCNYDKNPFLPVRTELIKYLDRAIDTNRWIIYNENNALLFKAELLIALRRYHDALECLDRVSEREGAAGSAQIRADAAMQRLLALRGMAFSGRPEYNTAQALSQFRSQVLIAMDRFPRDSRPLRIFFEYAYNVTKSSAPNAAQLPAQGDISLLELALKRLPFLLETDPDLAWMAAPFIRDVEEARRLVGAYRASVLSKEPPEGLNNQTRRSSYPLNYASIPVALNLGLIDDTLAAEELFHDDESIVLDIKVIVDTYNLLRSEEGREFFTRKLFEYSGVITSDDDRDGYIDTRSVFNSGIINSFIFDRRQNLLADLSILFDANAVPYTGFLVFSDGAAIIEWERYPSVKQVKMNEETLQFAPADFQYTPLSFIEIGGSRTLSGFSYPVPSEQYIDLTRRSLIYSCRSISRPSPEIENALETIYLDRGVMLQAVEKIGDMQVSVTEFERGLPVMQHIDLDMDGRMETVRRFRRPPQNYVWQDPLDYRRLISSSESDWSGDGRHKTREVYLQDGSVVYYFDMDGSGVWTHSETGNNR